jgi:type VI secretion system protein ImpG
VETNEPLYKEFLAELQALESFRMSYVAETPGAALQPDDPDVRRLVEALAFFGARARQAAVSTVVEQRRRLFRQFLPYLLDPLPAMGILQAQPTGQLTEALDLPRGTEIALRDGGDRVALFRTLRALRLLPLQLGRLSTVVLPDGRLRLLLPAATSHPRNDEIGTLAVHVNYLNDFNGSLRVLQALERRVDRVSVSFDDRVDEHSRGADCRLAFAAPGDDDDGRHPIERERSYFHFPRAELFFELTLPPPPRNWQRFTIMLDLKPDWPRGLRLTSDVFQLFATPIVNLSRAAAQPILHDGTRERWPLRHPSPAGRFALHSLRGVYRRAGETTVPLLPATVAAGSGSYELSGDALLLHLPEALTAPTTVSADAEWLQPWFSSLIGQRLRAAPYRRTVAGVQWELSGDLVPHREAALGGDVDDFTHILVLAHRRRLAREDLDALLQVMGTVWSGPFAPLRALVADLQVHEAPAAGGARGDGGKLVHELTLVRHEETLAPLIERFARHLERILSAWIADAPVEVRIGAGA